jgi:Flp pilus assembly protein TadG
MGCELYWDGVVAMAFGNKALARRITGTFKSRRGQMAVEMAVCIPVLLAVVGIAVNLMVFFGDCARFDRVAADAVRVGACSPGYGYYGSTSRTQAVQGIIEQSLDGKTYLSVTVQIDASGGSSGSSGSGNGITFSLLPNEEVYVCTLHYIPWGFGNSFFGINFTGIEHTRIYVIDPFRPGVLM